MRDSNPAYHIPVLLSEAMDGLNLRASGVFVDCTFGGGGHSTEILAHLNSEGRVYGFDQDGREEKCSAGRAIHIHPAQLSSFTKIPSASWSYCSRWHIS